MNAFDVHPLNPMFLLGTFIGAMVAFLFLCSDDECSRSGGRGDGRRGPPSVPGHSRHHGAHKARPDYKRCVEISTQSALQEMIMPSLLAILVPVVIGVLMGVAGVCWVYLAGGLATAFSLAIMMSNAGGAWDNAKKYIEEGHHGGKGSEAHKAAVVGDTVGDPFKDTSGPSLNILDQTDVDGLDRLCRFDRDHE